MVRPATVVVSRISGLREALAARGLAEGPWIKWHAENLDSSSAHAALAEAEVLVGEPAVCAPMIEQCPKLKWMQSTFAGCNQLLEQPRRDFVATRLGGCFGPDMAEYVMLHVLVRERQYEYQRTLQREKTWLAARSEAGAMQGGAAYRRLSTLTLGVLGLGEIGSCIAERATRGLGMRVVGWRRDGTIGRRQQLGRERELADHRWQRAHKPGGLQVLWRTCCSAGRHLRGTERGTERQQQ